MNIDFIKWMCDKAEGFEVLIWPNCMHIRVPFSREHSVDMNDAPYLFSNNKHLKGYLLQRAIEGANRENTKGLKIIQNDHDIIVMDYITNEVFEIIRVSYTQTDFRFDQAKESALMYIYEQESQ